MPARPRRARPASATAIVMLLAVALAGCIFPTLSGKHLGFKHARNGSGQITVESGHEVSSSVVSAVIKPWNTAAGRSLFVASTSSSAHVRFANQSPIYRNGDKARPISHWVQTVDNNGDGYYEHCTIYVDPRHPDAFKPYVLQHELGHCLGFRSATSPYVDAYNTDYQGVMSYIGFHNAAHRSAHWFGDVDREMLRAAGYAR